MEKIDENLKWMASGKMGCVFGTYFAKRPQLASWYRVFNPETIVMPDGAFMLSYVFPNKNKAEVRAWCLKNGFYEEHILPDVIGLRIKTKHGVAWVQYFGPDSHVKTRQAPQAEICFTVKLPIKSYFKVGINAVLHLAHASVESIAPKKRDHFWKQSFINTESRLGHKPTLHEAAKTTWLKFW